MRSEGPREARGVAEGECLGTPLTGDADNFVRVGWDMYVWDRGERATRLFPSLVPSSTTLAIDVIQLTMSFALL